ncbi:uncharacterized protein isoform X2 [Rhodnius prolixus]|uniref:uncharacterized protein isoform X2 n=1 Tax=Rhodnius prolixus TaxID=13249 RepID=UPI003D18D976
MGNCLSGCTTRPSSQNGGETVISYAAGKFYQTTTKEPTAQTDAEKGQSPNEKQVKEYNIVQKELEALQSQITHSQAVLASLKFTFLEASAVRKNLDKVHRTTQTLQDSQPKSLENVSSTARDKEWIHLTSSCPAIVHTANIAVQTEFIDVPKHQYVNDAEYFLPPIGSHLDLKGCKDQLRVGNPLEPLSGIDLDIYRSCRKLSVLPEEENAGDDSPPGNRLAPTKYPDHQAHSFESYLLPGEGSHNVFRQLSDPTTSRSTRRPLQVEVIADTITEPPRVQDSGLGSELRIPSPTFNTLQDTLSQLVTISYSSDPDLEPIITLRTPQPLSPETPFKTPPDVTPGSPIKNSSSDTSLSFQTPTEVSPGNQSPVEKVPSVSFPSVENEKLFLEHEKPLLSVLMDDRPSKDAKQENGKKLCPDTAVLGRVPSRRRLVRSLARIGSEMPLDIPPDSQSESLCEQPKEPEKEVKIETNLKDASDVKLIKSEIMEQNQNVFPSLSDTALRQLGLWLQSTSEEREPRIAEDDVEHKYTSLVLAFKTDKLTLTRRLELQNKLRDQAEINMTHEIETLRSSIQLLSTLCNDSEKSELYDKIRQQIENVYKSTLRVSSTAELFGAVQQENRLSKAVDIILRHVENLKQAYEKERTEHEETRKLLKENKIPAIAALKSANGKRRASIATVHQGQNNESSASSERRGSSSRRGSGLKKSPLTKNDSYNDMINCPDGDSLNKISEQMPDGLLHLDNLSNENMDSCTSHPNSSDIDTESEDELSLKKNRIIREEAEIKRKLPQRYKFRKRSSFCAPPWLLKMIGYLNWLQPYEDYALQARYFIAGLFVLAAICIVSSSFFIRYEDGS